MKKLALGLAIGLSCFSFAAHAKDACSNLSGKWVGKGKLVVEFVNIGKHFQCTYEGVATIASSGADSVNFSSNVSANLLSGICPATATLNMPGKCDDRNIVISYEDEYGKANLKGRLNREGTKATINGEVVIDMGNGKQAKGRLNNTQIVKQNS